MSISPARFTAALTALSAVLVLAPAAQAVKPVKDIMGVVAPIVAPILDPGPDACGYVGAQTFLPWHDHRGYALTPDGGFENGAAGWNLRGGSAVSEGNETFLVGALADNQSLTLPARSSALSAPTCVAKHDGIFRLFTRSTGSHARLRIDVLYANGRKGKSSVIGAHDTWTPTRSLAVAIGRAKKGRESTATIRMRFTPLSGSWQIDDVYLDPRLRN
jgi:hypothetical protein